MNSVKKIRDQEKEKEKEEYAKSEETTVAKESEAKEPNKEQNQEITSKPQEESEQSQESQENQDKPVDALESPVVEPTVEKTVSDQEKSNMPRPLREEPGAAGGVVSQQATDMRPEDDYQPPWDCKKGGGAVPFPNQIMQTSMDDPEYENTRHDYVNAPIGAAGKPMPNAVEGNFGGARPKERQGQATPQRIKQQKGSASDGRIGTYEEPWDLSSTTNMLEEAFLSKKFQPPPREKVSPTKEVTAAVGAASPKHYPPDTRPQEGYEKPWDWKPHKKVSFV